MEGRISRKRGLCPTASWAYDILSRCYSPLSIFTLLVYDIYWFVQVLQLNYIVFHNIAHARIPSIRETGIELIFQWRKMLLFWKLELVSDDRLSFFKSLCMYLGTSGLTLECDRSDIVTQWHVICQAYFRCYVPKLVAEMHTTEASVWRMFQSLVWKIFRSALIFIRRRAYGFLPATGSRVRRSMREDMGVLRILCPGIHLHFTLEFRGFLLIIIAIF